MYKFVFKLLKVSTAVFTATFLLAVNSPVRAESKTESTLPEAQPGVEVQRTDWSYKTLQQLASKYDCLPLDSAIFSTKRDYVSRQVFTTNLSTCLQSMEDLMARRRRRPAVRRRVVVPAPVAPVEPVAPAPAPVTPVEPTPVAPPAPPVVEIQEEPTEAITQQDIDNLKALISAFDSDLAALEKRITSKSFSTTTKLSGEVILNFGGYGGVPSTATRLGSNNYFGNRVRLNFDTSFTGKDRLRTRLQSRNIPSLATPTGTNMTRLGIDGSEGNDDYLGLLQYDFSLTDSTRVRIGATGYRFNDNQPTLNQPFASSANGAISRFGRFNPIFRLAGDGTAVTVAQKFSNELSLDVGYAVPGAINSTANASIVTPGGGSNNGFFGGQNAILTQLTYTPSKEFSVAALYGRSYNNAGGILGSTGSAAANNPFSTTAISSNIIGPTTNPSGAGKPAVVSTLAATTNANTTANHYSFLASYKLGDSAIISGWAGFVEANQAQATGGGSASISNYAISLAFPNFGAEGNMLGFVFGIPPKLNSRTVTIGGATNTTTGNPDTSYHLEALYKIRMTDNIDITPGLLLITSPEHNSANPTEYVGTIRTTFRF